MKHPLHHSSPALPRQTSQRGDNPIGEFVKDAGSCPPPREVGLGVIACSGSSEQPGPVVGVTEHAAGFEVVTPRFEFGGRTVTPDREAFAFAAVDGSWLEHHPGETVVYEAGGVLIEQCRADAWAAVAGDGSAGVADEAVRVDGAGEDPAAFGAPCDSGEQAVLVAACVVADPALLVGAVPEFAGDDRGPCLFDTQSARADEHAEDGFAVDDPGERAWRPPAPATRRENVLSGQVVSDPSPPGAGGSGLEDPLNDPCCVGVDDGLSVRGALIAECCASGEPACRGGSVDGDGEVFVGLVALPFGHDEQQAEHGASYGCGGVDLFGDADDACPTGVEVTNRGQATKQRSGEAVEAGDDDTTGQSGLDAAQNLVHAGPVHCAAAAVEVFMPRSDVDAVGECPPGDRVALLAGRLEAVSGASRDLRDTDIAVHDGLLGHRRRIVQCVASSPRSGEMLNNEGTA